MNSPHPFDSSKFSLEPHYPAPDRRQQKWHRLEVYGFLHFTVNTFTDKEWGYGDESPAVFNPTDFDADAIVSTAKAGGLKGLILTCKHHDGFCLWPSAYTEHSVKNSPWRGGRGDMVGEISAACARHGIQFGVYLSPWDRNRHDYGQPSYLEYFRNQLKELLGNYGPIFEIWFDGANGGDGYYGGARENRMIDKTTYYDWDHTWQIVRQMQPDACIFSDAGPDIRWVGNENGIAGDPCWATLSTDGLAPGLADSDLLNQGQRDGNHWLPAECDVSIRPGWFYHAAEDEKVKSPQELVNLYYNSVGKGASFLLNLPPDRRGRIHEKDADALRQYHEIIQRTFRIDLARGAKVVFASNGDTQTPFIPANINDGRDNTYWSPSIEEMPWHVILEFADPVSFNVVQLREYIPMGQRIDQFAVDQWKEDQWIELIQGTSIGSKRILKLPEVRTNKVRIRVLAAAAPPAISEVSLYRDEG